MECRELNSSPNQPRRQDLQLRKDKCVGKFLVCVGVGVVYFIFFIARLELIRPILIVYVTRVT